MYDFPERLQARMQKKGLKQVQLAKSTGISAANISRYLKGQRLPRPQQLFKLAESLDCSMSDLINLNSSKETQ